MNLTKKHSLLMDLRLLVHQTKTSFFISLIFLILLMSCTTSSTSLLSSSSTGTSRILNNINNDIPYRKNTLVELNQHNSHHINSYNNSFRLVVNSISTSTLNNQIEKTILRQQQQQEYQEQKNNQEDKLKFSQPLNKYNLNDENDSGFRPIKPQDLDQNYVQNALFTADGHFRVFEETSLAPAPTTIDIHKEFQNKENQQPSSSSLSSSSLNGFKPFKPLPQIHVIERRITAPAITATEQSFYPVPINRTVDNFVVEKHVKRNTNVQLNNHENLFNSNYNAQSNAAARKESKIDSAYPTEKPTENTIESYLNPFQELINYNSQPNAAAIKESTIDSTNIQFNKHENLFNSNYNAQSNAAAIKESKIDSAYPTEKPTENTIESYLNPFRELINSNMVNNLQKYLLGYVHDALSKDTYELFPGVSIEKKKPNPNNTTNIQHRIDNDAETNNGRSFNSHDNSKGIVKVAKNDGKIQSLSFGRAIGQELTNFIDDHIININIPRSAETGRLFIFKGLKKLLWPLFIGVQIAKSILLALFLPSILGSLGKMVGKGLVQVSGFNHPSESVNDLDFRDNAFNFMNDDNNKYMDDYSYPKPEASENHFTAHLYEKATNNMNNALSRYGFGDHKKPHTNTNAHNMQFMDTDSKNSHSKGIATTSIKTSKNSYKDFLKVPSSSLLLSNYDPFYSPLLSRIDSVFSQLGLAKGQESCKEKLVCLMYAHPAKYAPYSNLVSAQLSRELNELRKPTSNNEEILRFFKYMKAAKNGQDGVDCEKAYEICPEYQDSDDPVMITTFNDINKLVQARKIGKR